MIPLPPSGGRARERGVNQIFLSTAERGSNHLDHANGVTKHVEIPKSKDSIAALFEVCRSFGVVVIRLIVAVSTAVQLDQQVFRSAGKVGYVWANRLLPPEFVAIQPESTQR